MAHQAELSIEKPFGEEPRFIARKDGPETSVEAAHTVDTANGEEIVYAAMMHFGQHGCVLDDLRDYLYDKVPEEFQYSLASRRTGLHRKGKVLDTGYRRKGKSGVGQIVYVCREVLDTPELFLACVNHPNARNPFYDPPATVETAPHALVNHEQVKDVVHDILMQASALKHLPSEVVDYLANDIADQLVPEGEGWTDAKAD